MVQKEYSQTYNSRMGWCIWGCRAVGGQREGSSSGVTVGVRQGSRADPGGWGWLSGSTQPLLPHLETLSLG